MPQLPQFIVFLVALFPVASAGQEQKPLVDLEEQRPAQGGQVQVRGVVTFFEPAWQGFIVQNGDQAVRVALQSGIETPDSLTVGDIVRVDGRTLVAAGLRQVAATSIVRTGTGELPKPASLQDEDALSQQSDGQFVECEGVVFRADADRRYVYLTIATPQYPLRVFVQFPDGTDPDVTEWLGQTIRVRGVVRFPIGEECAARIMSSMSLLQRVPASDTGIAAGARFQRIGTLLESDTDTTVPTGVIGQAISSSQSSDLIVQDQTGFVRVEATKLPDVSIGDIVIARGFVRNGEDQLPVISGEVECPGPGVPLVPIEVATDKASAHAYEYIETEGTFRGFRQTGEKLLPVLSAMETTFTLSGPDEVLAVFDQVPVESHFRVIGTSRPSVGKAYAFELMVSDVEVVYQPMRTPVVGDDAVLAANSIPAVPTISSSPPGGSSPDPAPLGPVIVAAVSCLLMLVFLVALLVVLRRTREQKKFYAAIHEQLNEVSHVSRLNTLAEMVGALAHELNQPLASVANFAETAKILSSRSADQSSQLEHTLERISSETLRAGEIIRRLRTLVQRKTAGQVPTSMNQVVNDALDMFRMRELVASGTLEIQLDDDLPDVEIDSIQFQQVILNFLLNARDATTGLDGRLPKIIVRTAWGNGFLKVTVDDNGPGIASSDPQAVFEPYFTTKGDGMGLGLAISRTIVESHNGTISAESLEPYGARMTLSLPVELAGRLEAA